MTTPDASTRGRANRRRGATCERDLARWLRGNGFPHAERAVRTGYRTTDRVGADYGDIIGIVGVVIQVTDRADLDQDAVLARRLAETEAQRQAAGADLGLLVQKRRGCADPGRWWVWIDGGELSDIAWQEHLNPKFGWPVRCELRHLVPLLVRAGYGREAA